MTIKIKRKWRTTFNFGGMFWERDREKEKELEEKNPTPV
jgi:hypothetical protein